MKRRSVPQQAAREHIPCAHAQCPHPAITRIDLERVKDVKLCRQHYEHHVSDQAREFCKRNNLTTRTAQRKYVTSYLERFPRPHRTREPGEEG